MIYGVQPTGFVRKPLSQILAEIEAANITEFGPGLVQTAQSPMGQLNGLFADLAAQLWELAEDVYQSYDPDQAEGISLDTLGRIRLLSRGAEDDQEFRRSITNEGRARIDLQDIARAVLGLPEVTYVQVFSNDTSVTDENGIPPTSVAVAVIGGDDDEIASTVRFYVVPGVNTFGNYPISTNIEGFCRTVTIIRPIDILVTLEIEVRTGKDSLGCPPPSMGAIEQSLIDDWMATRTNGKDLTHFTIRSLIESRFPNVEVVSFQGSRDGIDMDPNQPVPIAFFEIASLTVASVSVVPFVDSSPTGGGGS